MFLLLSQQIVPRYVQLSLKIMCQFFNDRIENGRKSERMTDSNNYKGRKLQTSSITTPSTAAFRNINQLLNDGIDSERKPERTNDGNSTNIACGFREISFIYVFCAGVLFLGTLLSTSPTHAFPEKTDDANRTKIACGFREVSYFLVFFPGVIFL